jgi:hypothetical protein
MVNFRLIQNAIILYEKWSTMGKPIVLFFIVITTSGTNPWSFVTYIPQLTPGYSDDRKTFEMTTSI